MGERELQNICLSYPHITQKDPHTLNISLANVKETKLDHDLFKLQSVATLIHILKKCALIVQKDIWKLRRLNFQATIGGIDLSRKQSLSNNFEATKKHLEDFVNSIYLNGIPILCGSQKQTLFLLTPDPNIKEIKLFAQNSLENGIYDFAYGIEDTGSSPVFSLALYQGQNKICELNTGESTLTPTVPQKISGLEVVFNTLAPLDLLRAEIGLINDAKLLSVGIKSFIYPGKYKILVQQSNDGLRAFLGRFSAKITNYRAEVGGLALEFSRNLHAAEPNSKLTEINVGYVSNRTPIQLITGILPLTLEFDVLGKHQTMELLPMLPEALVGNAFGKIVSLADLNIEKGFDPSVNLEVLESINLSLNNYDKALTSRLTYLKKLFTSQSTALHSANQKRLYSNDPVSLLKEIEDKLKVIPFRMFLKE